MPAVPEEIRGQPEKHLDAPYLEVTEGPPDNHLVYPLRRVDLEVTSKGVEGNKVRKETQQLEPCATRNGHDLVKKGIVQRQSLGTPSY